MKAEVKQLVKPNLAVQRQSVNVTSHQSLNLGQNDNKKNDSSHEQYKLHIQKNLSYHKWLNS